MPTNKRPSWQFYPGDWMKDTDLRSVSSGARGLWIDMLCLMWESGRRGYLQVNGNPVTVEMLARMTGNSPDDASRFLLELEYSGVFSRTGRGENREGIIYSRRMVRDEANRKKWRENGRRGGNPRLLIQKEGQTPPPGVKQNGDTSSSLIKEEKEDNPLLEQAVGELAALAEQTLTGGSETLIRHWSRVYPTTWIAAALHAAAIRKRRNPAYVAAVLDDYQINGGPKGGARVRAGERSAAPEAAEDYAASRTGERL